MRTLTKWWILLPVSASLYAQAFSDPPVSAPYRDAIKGFKPARNYTFGESRGNTVRSLDELSDAFVPYGIAGKNVINQEWERYQPFNERNFVFRPNALDLTATIPEGGGLVAGGIHSGQIWSKEVFQPGVTGYAVYGFEIRMKIPRGPGMWPAFWLYAKEGPSDASEIDHPEFFIMRYQDQFDWTGSTHGPGMGSDFYSLKTNKFVWRPGVDFSADYHDYETLWTPDAVYKYVDGKLVLATKFKWTATGAAQMGANLAVGTDSKGLIGLQPDSLSQFPSALSIEHIKVWAK